MDKHERDRATLYETIKEFTMDYTMSEILIVASEVAKEFSTTARACSRRGWTKTSNILVNAASEVHAI
jgi:hypothetical protein